jgi:hypothetical protein
MRCVSSYMLPRRGTALGICIMAALGGKTRLRADIRDHHRRSGSGGV